MRIVVSTDWHPDTNTAGYARFDDVDEAVHATVAAAVDLKADYYMFWGDLITNDPVLDLMVRCICLAQDAARELERHSIPSFWMPGNHDVFEDGRGTTALDPIASSDPMQLPQPGRGRNMVHLVKRPNVYALAGGHVVFLPFTPLSHGYDPAEFVRSLFDDDSPHPEVKLVCGHLTLEGIGPGSETLDTPRGRDVLFPIDLVKQRFPNAVLGNGHYHRRQVYRGVQIPGSLVRGTRAEADNEPGYLVLEL